MKIVGDLSHDFSHDSCGEGATLGRISRCQETDAPPGNRTLNLLIKSQLLYQLS